MLEREPFGLHTICFKIVLYVSLFDLDLAINKKSAYWFAVMHGVPEKILCLDD